jgi:hypothetical protein
MIYFRTNTNKNIIGNAFILFSRIKPRNKDKVSINVYVGAPYMCQKVSQGYTEAPL